MMNKDTQSSVFSSRRRGAFEIALLYLLIGILWIVFSDEAAAALAPNQAALTQISIYKGWGYVLVTALLLYWMIGLYTKRLSRAEWTLGESEKNYQELLEQASDGIFIADAQGQYTLVNEEGCRLLGYTQAELLSMNLRELIAPEDIQKTPPRLDELKNGKTLFSERILLRKDGSRILCEISAKQFPDGRYQSIIRDITERKVTDDALLRGEQRYRSLFENMTNGFARCQMLYDEKGTPNDFIYLDVNQAFEKLTGLKNVLGKRVSVVIPGIRESNPELFEIYGRVALTGKPEKFETYVPGLRSGIWFSTSVYSTEKNFFVTVFEVITERKQAETALRENEERLRLSLHAANQGLYDLNVQTGDAIVNREYVEMLGYDFDTFVETNAAWIERLHPDDREITATAYADYIKGLTPEYRVEFRQKTKAGGWKWILSLGKVAEYDSAGKPLRMLGTHTDITVRKQAEETLQKAHDELEYQVQLRTQALSQTNTLLETMLEYMPDQIYFKDAESRFIRNSKAQTLALGLSDSSQVIGKTDFDFFPHAQRSYDEEQEIIRSGKPLVDFEEWVVWPSGQEMWVSTTKVPLRNQAGEVIGTFGISRDITERKRNEAALLKAKEELEFKVAERTTELSEINEQLELELSERKQAEEKLKASEFRFRLAAESLTDVIYEWDIKEKVDWFGDVDALMGYAPGTFPRTLTGWAALLHPDDQERVLAAIDAQLKGGAAYNIEYRVATKHGAWRWWSARGVAVRDPYGEPYHWIGSISDITERMQKNEALKKSEAKYRTLHESMIDGFVSVDMQGNFLECNEVYRNMLGYSDAELATLTYVEITPETWHAYETEVVENQILKRGFSDVYEKEYRRKDGTIFPVELHTVLLRDEAGTSSGMWAIVRDITERKQAEAKLRHSEEQYRLMFTSNPLPIFVFDRKTFEFLAVNDATVTQYGYSREELLQMTIKDIRPPEDIPTMLNLVAAKSAPYSNIGVVRHRKKDGTLIDVEITRHDILFDGHDALIVLINDVTERKQTEEKILDSELRYRRLFESAKDGILILDAETGLIVDVNPFLTTLLDYPYEYFLGKRLWELGFFKDIVANEENFQELLQKKYIRYEDLPLESANGKRMNVEFVSNVYQVDHHKVVQCNIRDITERKHAEDALQRSEKQYRTLFEKATDGIFIADAAGNYTDVNPAGLKMLGYVLDEFIGLNVVDVVIPVEAPNLDPEMEYAQEQSKNDNPMPQQWHFKRKDSSIFIGEVSGGLMPDGKVLGILRDITERKRAEETIRESRDLFLKAFRANPAAMVITRLADGTIIDLNASYEQIFEYSREELIGKTSVQINIMVDPEERNIIVKKLQADGHVYGYETTLRARSGKLVNALFSIEMIEQAGEQCMLSIIYDFTERKHAEEELRASKKLMQDVVDNTAALVYILDLEGRFLLVNHTTETLFGLPSAQIVGQTRSAFLPAEFATQHRNNDLEIIQTGQGKLFEEENREPDGRHVYLTNKFPLFDTRDQVYAVCGISTDMTERKRMEEELQRSNAELEQFAYVASHDLQEPLRAVAGMVQLLGQRYQGKLDERADEYIGHAVEASERMQKLINDLLDYSRVNRLGRSFESTHVEKSLNTALANLQLVIQESQAQITHDPLPSLMTDSGQLTQVLQNLIGNAIKFRGARPLHIHIGAKKIEHAWQFSVSDNGIGIESKYYERIFLVFQRLHTRREYPGTGIGLALCKKIIERHNGQIWVESQPGLGSTFYFTIPERQP